MDETMDIVVNGTDAAVEMDAAEAMVELNDDKISQQKLDKIVATLNLSKLKAELLARELKPWLAKGVKITSSRTREHRFIRYFAEEKIDRHDLRPETSSEYPEPNEEVNSDVEEEDNEEWMDISDDEDDYINECDAPVIVYCTDIPGLFNEMGMETEQIGNVRLFIDSDKHSMKAVLLDNGNVLPSVLIAYAKNVKECRESLSLLLAKIKYNE